MKIVIPQHVLAKPLEQISKALPNKTTIPILSNILLRADDEGLTLIVGDISVFIKTVIPTEYVTVERQGAITLPGKKIVEIVKKLSGDITIEVDKTNATIYTGKSKFELAGIEADEYPEFPQVIGDIVHLPGEVLKRNIAQTIYATSDQESMPILTGVLFKLTSGNIRFVGCDRHRLAQKESNIESDLDFSVVVGRESLSELTKLIDDKETVELQISSNNFMAKTKYYTFFSRVLEGSYPDTDRLIPTDFNTTVSVKTTKFIESLERVFIVANEEKTKVVKMSVGDDIEIKSEASGSKASDRLEIQHKEGDDITVAFNAKYALDALKAIDGPEIIIQFVGPMQPMIIKGKDDDSALHMILPYRT
jgi:DNA polymerase-3 subunit beta